MKFQTNPSLGPFLNHWGCHIHSILSKVEKVCGGAAKFSNDDVLTVYFRGMSEGWIQREVFDKEGRPLDGCLVLARSEKDGTRSCGDLIFNFGAELLGVPFLATGYRKESSEYVPVAGEEEILCLNRKSYSGEHFVSGTGIVGSNWKKEIEFDPIEGGSNCARDGWIASKRILTIVHV